MSFVLDYDRIGPSGRPTLRLKSPMQLPSARSRQMRGARVIELRSKGRQAPGSTSKQAKAAALAWLKATFPAFKRSLPLPLGVHDLVAPAAARAGFSGVAVRAAIAKHVSSRRYLAACVRPGSKRHDLSGRPIQELDQAHRHHAARRLAALPPPPKRRR